MAPLETPSTSPSKEAFEDLFILMTFIFMSSANVLEQEFRSYYITVKFNILWYFFTCCVMFVKMVIGQFSLLFVSTFEKRSERCDFTSDHICFVNTKGTYVGLLSNSMITF